MLPSLPYTSPNREDMFNGKSKIFVIMYFGFIFLLFLAPFIPYSQVLHRFFGDETGRFVCGEVYKRADLYNFRVQLIGYFASVVVKAVSLHIIFFTKQHAR